MGDRYHSVFDIIGPIMVGPSSSHTAGAARIGKVVRKIFGTLPEKVTIYLYESFAKTYQGHGTDIALIGGLLDDEPDDPRLPQSLERAKALGIDVQFIPTDEVAEHPNSAKIVLEKGQQKLEVLGCSIGGGNIQISEVNGFKIKMQANQPTILIVHQDLHGAIAKVATVLAEQGINIATMMVSRKAKGDEAIMVIEVDEKEIDASIEKMLEIPMIHQASFFQS
ncbi:L-serine ammonia-lyase, iron-sulfur-dependent subunit beta [Isobaculum melis]|uniref:L-serine deaminase n=1 Tax=Isobaculum melis TaxID=142588 RepID=A0A1H9RAQ7_9LACT|nr:L-serine ammonia-lyase, iron-sulfur-dependent subunit beta [Isobaculum melis]SER69802.1 L-serine dehydratase [Isobaculum melis]